MHVTSQSSVLRKLFSRNKQQQQQTSSWRIFSNKHAKKTGSTAAPSTALAGTADDLYCSTTGLILEDRPSNLPAKSVEEQRRHQAQYQALIEAAKRKEARRACQRKKFLEMRRKEEEEAAAAVRVWSNEILPNWEHMKDTKRCHELWWRGIPSKVRGQVWSLVIGNELNLTPELYEICVARARQHFATVASDLRGSEGDTAAFASVESNQQRPFYPVLQSGDMGREGTLELIHLDISRTFPNLGFFQKVCFIFIVVF
ncbi:unnamed protein product [Gongylonema pulchrum]|uniref:Rab-GAP TBC domain-containing protein n=1 Tax=Gongylonema pulchrum TaxID=637853 RepID=A0A3P7NZG1_9BILA|nr:unnamed protein product [Gongylonema pulchrum]